MAQTTKLTMTSALVLALAAGPLFAQDSGETAPKAGDTGAQGQTDQSAGGGQSNQSTGGGQGGQSTGRGGDQSADGSTGQSGETSGMARTSQPDAVVVTVGETGIVGSDVSEAIALLPPQIRQQPPAMLVPMAVNQLIARELILQAAIAESLDEDPEVIALVEETQQSNQQDAMVQVWLQRELDERVTEEEVQAEHDEIAGNTDQDIPPFEAVRAQIEQQLRQEAFAGLQENLREDVEITYYGPNGEPRQASSGDEGQNEN